MASLKEQALILTLANAYTRAMGFGLRLITARLMGAQALGVMELASSAVMLAVTPVTAGVPTAMSRLSAQPGQHAAAVLRAGLSLVKRLTMLLTPAMLLLSPGIAWLLGDMRTLPSILVSLPLIGLLGLCAVYSGWFYGKDNARIPALNECAEQTVRCALAIVLLILLTGRSAALTASLPLLAEVAAGLAVWGLYRWQCRGLPRRQPDPGLCREIVALTAPATGARLCQTALRMLNAVLLPVCLRRSGLSAEAATAQFGLLNGMAMPLLMLPGIATGAICMLATPAVSRQEHQPERLKRTIRQLLSAAGGIGLAASAALWVGADFIGSRVYNEPVLTPLLRVLAPMSLLSAIAQVQFGMISGLGLQTRALTGTVAASFLTLGITAVLCPMPSVRLFGAAIASLVGTLLRVIWYAVILCTRPQGIAAFRCQQ